MLRIISWFRALLHQIILKYSKLIKNHLAMNVTKQNYGNNLFSSTHYLTASKPSLEMSIYSFLVLCHKFPLFNYSFLSYIFHCILLHTWMHLLAFTFSRILDEKNKNEKYCNKIVVIVKTVWHMMHIRIYWTNP
jgi:hypothetical protein